MRAETVRDAGRRLWRRGSRRVRRAVSQRRGVLAYLAVIGPGMVAANGGDATGGCNLPPQPTGLDWVMGGNGTPFSGYARVRVPGISDHPIVYSDVTLTNVVTRRVQVPVGQH